MTDHSLLSSRAIVGMYYAALEAMGAENWASAVANQFSSDQASETYNWIGQTPAMREWIGGRHAKGLSGEGVTIVNRHYEATIEFKDRDRRRDKTGQIEARIGEFADRGQTQWASLLSTLIASGETTVCYDGQYFFDTDHSEGSSGTQSNDIQVDISTLPVETEGTTSNPSKEQMQLAILQGIAQILGLKDDQGEPMNESANEFLVFVPIGLYLTAISALSDITQAAMNNNMNPNLIAGLQVRVQLDARSNWTEKFAIFRTDSPVKALIMQTEQDTELMAKGETSDFYFDNKAIQIGIDAWRGVGFGHWQRACLVTLI